MGEIGQAQQQLVAPGLGGGGLFVEFGDFVAQVAGFLFFSFGLGGLLLAHQRADFLGNAVALGLEGLDFREQFAALLVVLQQIVNPGFSSPPPRVARRWRTLVRMFAHEFDVEHRGIIGSGAVRASGE